MSIRMIGIDHNRAEVDIRGLFSFSKNSSVEAMEKITGLEGVKGCVILSTCNRMELWTDMEDNCAVDLYRQLCLIKGVDGQLFRDAFVERCDKEAVLHLFRLSSGMKSLILGEDQILTQVKDAVSLSRENNFSNSTLEVLFRMAVTAAKQVKTEVIFPHGSLSAVDRAVESLENQGKIVGGKICMVIGNGQMGKLSAQAFADAGALVYVTVRRYNHGKAEIPKGCQGISYEKRAEYLKKCDYIVSATASPHYTLTKDMFKQNGYKEGIVVMDLAVPRDIDENIKDLDNLELYDIDDFKSESKDAVIEKAVNQAEVIIQAQITEFYNWMNGIDLVPRIQMIRQEAAEDVMLRLTKPIRKLDAEEQEKERLRMNIEKAAEKAINKMLFGLKERLSAEEFANCVKGLEQLYGEE